MYQVFLKNGYFEVHGDIDDIKRFSWLTCITQNGRDIYYFHANNTTRKLFAEQMLKDPKCVISSSDLDYLKNLRLGGRIATWQRDIKLPNTGPDKKMKPYQIACIKRMLEHKNYCMFLGPGTGKTLIAISYMLNMKPKNILVLTPKKVINQYLKNMTEYLDYTPDKLLVTNFEQLLSKPEQFMGHWDCMIIDESHRLKDFTSKSNAFIREYIHPDRMFLFSGTPQDKNRFEIFSQFALFDKRFVPSKNKFLYRYFELDQYYKPTKEKRPEELTNMIKLVSCGAQTEDLIDLTLRVDHKIYCKKPAEYKEFAADKLIDEDDFTLICDTPSKVAIKLRQLCNGFLTDDNGKTRRYETNKCEKFKDLIKTLKDAIVFTTFDEDIKIISEILDAEKRSYVVVNGKTKQKDSDDNIEKFKSGEVEFLVIQINSGNAGLDLTNTANVVFWALPVSYITYDQCIHRIRRLGQKEDCNYYYLICEGTVEKHIERLLANKKSFNANLYKIYKGVKNNDE